ncbi:hypothetical protein BV22DRAFT_1052715, partial [Leucogyrophana mollusca]
MPPIRDIPQAIVNSMRERHKADLIMRINKSKRAVLEFDHEQGDLRVWFWPVNERGERVAPSDFEAHRRSHRFLGPRCLCAFTEDPTPEGGAEAAIVVLTQGPNAGEYVACCSRSMCGFI